MDRPVYLALSFFADRPRYAWALLIAATAFALSFDGPTP